MSIICCPDVAPNEAMSFWIGRPPLTYLRSPPSGRGLRGGHMLPRLAATS
jgi:hypothetical protein